MFIFFFFRKKFFSRKKELFSENITFRYSRLAFFFYYQLNEIMISRKLFLFSDLVVSHVGETCYLSPSSLPVTGKRYDKIWTKIKWINYMSTCQKKKKKSSPRTHTMRFSHDRMKKKGPIINSFLFVFDTLTSFFSLRDILTF